MKVLITGSHGFVGSNLIDALSGEHEIIRWDIRSDEKLPDCDAVVHLAGKAHDVRCKKEDGREYFEVNTELTKKMFDKFLLSKAKKFIFFSSIKAKDNDTAYAKSKLEAEHYIISTTLSPSSQEEGSRKVYILRPCMIHGKGVKGNLPLLFNVVKKRMPWPLAAFENQRSYASMGNVAYVVNELLMKNVKSGTYNICDDESISTNDLVRLISQAFCRNAKMLRLPKWFVLFGARLGDVLRLPLNSERLTKLTCDYVVDNSDIKKALNISSLPLSAKEGLMFTIKSMVNDKY